MSGKRKSLVFRKIQSFVNRKFIKKNDHIIDIYVNTTTWLVILSGTKRPQTDIIGKIVKITVTQSHKICFSYIIDWFEMF